MPTKFEPYEPTDAERKAALGEFFGRINEVQKRRGGAAAEAITALPRLIAACAGKSGQGYKLRALLYSLWNGQPADLSDVLNLDYNLREDLCKVILAFGYEDRKGAGSFFYNEITNAFKSAGLYEWFLECHKGEETK
jgi:hypothetical protein